MKKVSREHIRNIDAIGTFNEIFYWEANNEDTSKYKGGK